MERRLITKIGNNGNEYDGWFDIGDKRVKYWQLQQDSRRIYQTANGNWLYYTWGKYLEPDIFKKCTPAFVVREFLLAGIDLPDILLPLIVDDEV
ncbi:MAG: hypothetical protein GY718_10710 [Lentisphaerae bacterium]|nr:hypothetical protein [Lentisphaerota bacterium]